MTFEEAIDHFNYARQFPDLVSVIDTEEAFNAVLQKVCDLDARCDKLESRFESMLEVNEMWDGS